MTDGRPTIFADPAMPLPILLSGSVPRVAQRRDMSGNLAPRITQRFQDLGIPRRLKHNGRYFDTGAAATRRSLRREGR
jgi:hypothetical protein